MNASSSQYWLAKGLLTLLVVSSPLVNAQDAKLGLAVYEAKCSGCHSVDSHRVGPKHFGVLGRTIGGADDFNYSAALRQKKQSNQVWSVPLLISWLKDPEALIPGQSMGFRLNDDKEIIDVVAYLASLH